MSRDRLLRACRTQSGARLCRSSIVPYHDEIQIGGELLLEGTNGSDNPARAVDSTQVKKADRGLGVHVRPAWA